MGCTSAGNIPRSANHFLKFGSSLLVKVLLPLAGGKFLICKWSSVLDNTAVRPALIKLSLLILFLRFLVSAVLLSNKASYRGFSETNPCRIFPSSPKSRRGCR